jgi:hypothetical protein
MARERQPSALQVPALARMVGERGRGRVRAGRRAAAMEPREQVGTDGVEEMVALELQAIDERARRGRTSTSPTATARLSATTGFGAVACT